MTVLDQFLPHLENPCGTEAGNLREFYIREGERLLKTVSKIDRQRLGEALRMARLLAGAEETISYHSKR